MPNVQASIERQALPRSGVVETLATDRLLNIGQTVLDSSLDDCGLLSIESGFRHGSEGQESDIRFMVYRTPAEIELYETAYALGSAIRKHGGSES